MKGIEPTNGAGAPATDVERAKLRQLAHQFEGVFLDQLFQAMRKTVPQGGFIEKSPGEDMFTSMLDERLAGAAAERLQRGLGDALYRQLSRRLATSAGPDGGAKP